MATVDFYKYEKKEVLNYFDQFADYEIDLTSYLQKFSQDGYPITFSNLQPVKTKVKNIFSKINVDIDFKNSPSDFESYTIKDDDTPINISFNKYGLVDYWWIIFAFNKIENPYKQWPLNHEEIITLVDALYLKEKKYNKLTYYNLIFEANEAKRKILLPTISLIVSTIVDYRRLIQKGS
jgi:hypothetical protein